MRRFFSALQRRWLVRQQGYRCAGCGIAISPSTAQADHVIPYSKGGATELSNAQALCSLCNQHKSDHMTLAISTPITFGDWQQNLPPGFSPRQWQADAINAFHSYVDETDYNVSFTAKVDPGFGKTIFASLIGKTMRDARLADWLVVLVPNLNLVKQTIEDAPQTGIQLTEGALGLDRASLRQQGYSGEVLTYQMLLANQKVYQQQASRYGSKWVLVKDEAHRLADPEDKDDSAAWSRAIDYAFMPYIRYRVTMTGTLFRSDEYSIADVPYGPPDEEGLREAQPHFATSMPEGITNAWVRRLIFQTQKGRVEWVEQRGESLSSRAADLSDDNLKRADRTAALQTALDIGLPFAQELLRQGYAELQRRRKETRDAAMLVICKDANHARDCRDWIKEELGVNAPLVLGEDSSSNDAIKRFKAEEASNDQIIVAVKMISEGCSIKRLQVGVMLTNVITQLNFRQTGARCNRNRTGKYETATWFIPALPEFLEYALKYEQEVVHVIQDGTDEEGESSSGPKPRPLCAYCEDPDSNTFTGECPGPGVEPCPLSERRKLYRVGSEATTLEVVAAGDSYDTHLWAKATALATQENTDPDLVARILRSAGLVPEPVTAQPQSISSQLEDERGKYNRYVDAACRAIMARGVEASPGEVKRAIHKAALRQGHAKSDTRDLEAMQRKAAWAADTSNCVEQVWTVLVQEEAGR